MAFTLTDEYIALLRGYALAAEPYPDDDRIFNFLDGEFTTEESARMESTRARERLRAHGLTLREGQPDPPEDVHTYSNHHAISDEEIRQYRKHALAAEPYSRDDHIFKRPPSSYTQDEWKRLHATSAREFLQEHGIPLEEPEEE